MPDSFRALSFRAITFTIEKRKSAKKGRPSAIKFKEEINIQLLTLFKASLMHPHKLIEARNVKKGKIFLYILFISLISSLPIFVQSYQILNDFRNDGQIIAESIPAFKIENGQIITEEPAESFIYQTDSIIFTFDPAGQQTTEDVDRNLIGTTIGIALLEDRFYLSVPGYPLQFSYSQLDGVTDAFFADVLFGVQSIDGFLLLVVLLFVWLFSLLLVLIYNLLYTILANLISVFIRRDIRFGENWKIVLFASTLPIIFFSLLNIFNLVPRFQFEITVLLTLYFYYLAIRQLPDESPRKR